MERGQRATSVATAVRLSERLLFMVSLAALGYTPGY